MQKIKVYTRSLGCPKNLVDTENILGALGEAYEPVLHPEESHVVLINTCAFIQPAVEESLDTILSCHDRINRLEAKPLLAVTGCLVSRYGASLSRALPEPDILCPIETQTNLPEMLASRLGVEHNPVPGPRLLSSSSGFAYLKISEGCSNKCAFCAIPSIRGRLRSRSLDEILNEAACLADRGIKELIVVAQDTTAYGRDLGLENGLLELLGRLAELKGLAWIRVMYMYPSGITRNLLAGMAEIGPPVLPYFDIPFQHSHPDILTRMGRPFRRDPWKVISMIREYFSEAALRTTLIVGYPGETAGHFRHLREFVRRAKFQHLGVFPFYPEEGTRAAKFSRAVSAGVKQQRLDGIMAVQKTISADLLAEYTDEVLEIMVDGPHPEWPGLFSGRAWFQAPEVDGMSYVSGPGVKPGEIVQARVHETRDYDLITLQEQE